MIDTKHLIDVSGWGEFKVGDYFTQERGKEKAPKQNKDGDCLLIQETNSNNGFDRLVQPTVIFKGNAITISINYASNVFYQKDDFCASVNIAIIRNDNLNLYNGYFIASVLSSAHRKFDYQNKISKELIDDEIIKLPATPDGQPDWDYMESYMKAVMEESEKSLENLKKADDTKHLIDVSGWGEFKIGDLFDIHPTKAYKLTNAQLLDDGNYPVIANSAYNNGIGGYSTKEPTENGNMVTFSDTVDANTIFYQKEPFVGYPHVQGLYPIKYEDKWNELTYQFFVSVFRGTALVKGFDYGNKFRRDIAVELMVKLPITSTGDPNWQYMEDYMRSIMDKSEKAVEDLRKAV